MNKTHTDTRSALHQEAAGEFHSVSLWRQLADASVAAGDWEMATQVGEATKMAKLPSSFYIFFAIGKKVDDVFLHVFQRIIVSRS